MRPFLIVALAVVAAALAALLPGAPFTRGSSQEGIPLLSPVEDRITSDGFRQPDTPAALTPTGPPGPIAPESGQVPTERGDPISPTATFPPPGTPTPAGATALENLAPDVNPLTGLPVPDQSRLERWPIAVKITHFPRQVRPQWGLTLADLVYEYYLEHGMTRFVALYYGEDTPRVGPVRSARFFDEHVFRMYTAAFVFANADRRVLDHLLETEFVNAFVVERPGHCPPLCRDRSGQVFNAYNNLFADTAAITRYLRAERELALERPDLRALHFSARPPDDGLPVSSIAVHFSADSYHRWTYEPADSRYRRWQETAPDSGDGGSLALLTDRLTGQPVAADNVVVLMVPHRYYSEQPEIVTMDLWGYGSAYLFRDGIAYRAFWRRTRPDAPLTLVDTEGALLPLKPGKTFFEVIGESSRVWQLGRDRRFDFRIP